MFVGVEEVRRAQVLVPLLVLRVCIADDAGARLRDLAASL